MGDSEEDINFESADEEDVKQADTKKLENKQEIKETDKKELNGAEQETQPAWNWGAFSQMGSDAFNQASSTVSAFTSHVGDSLVHALDSVQSGFIASDNKETEDANWQSSDEPKESVVEPMEGQKDEPIKEQGWLGSWGLPSISTVVNSASSVVQQTTQSVGNTGLKMMNTGLDVLETLGKKTYDVVVEGDMGLKQVIQKNKQTQPNLSQILREAKNQSDINAKESNEETLMITYTYWFDHFNGIANLEALEHLSKTSNEQLQIYLAEIPKTVVDKLKMEQTRIKQIFETCRNQEDLDDQEKHNFNEDLDKYSFDSTIPVTISKLLQNHDEFVGWMYKFENKTESDETYNQLTIRSEAMKQLASFTVLSVEHLHKICTVLLRENTPPKGDEMSHAAKDFNCVDVAAVVARLVRILDHELTNQASQYATCLSSIQAGGETKDSITNIYFEAANSSSYVYKSFQLLLPVVQLVSIRQHQH